MPIRFSNSAVFLLIFGLGVSSVRAGEFDPAASWVAGLHESTLKTAALAIPRTAARLGNRLVRSSVVQRVLWTVEGPVTALTKGGLSRGTYKLANGVTNPGAVANSAVSDVGGLVRGAFQVTSRPSTRVQLCTENFWDAWSQNDRPSPMHFIMPAEHIALMVDGFYPLGNDGADIVTSVRNHNAVACMPADIRSGEPESIAVERLFWIWDHYDDRPYQFASYNCGGIAEALLHAAGFVSPTFANLGVGAEIPIPSDARRKGLRAFRELAVRSNHHIALVQKLMAEVAAGTLTDSTSKSILEDPDGIPTSSNFVPSPDLALDLFAAATHHRTSLPVSLVEWTAEQLYRIALSVSALERPASARRLRRHVRAIVGYLSEDSDEISRFLPPETWKKLQTFAALETSPQS